MEGNAPCRWTTAGNKSRGYCCCYCVHWFMLNPNTPLGARVAHGVTIYTPAEVQQHPHQARSGQHIANMYVGR
jgi:hypothetical protein